jgi:UDPglucose 6-dehydrogenase
MKKIAIIGYGYVGKAMEQFFKDHYEIVVYDPYVNFGKGARGNDPRAITRPNLSSGLQAKKNEVNKCYASFVCVPTPRSEDGSCDVSIVEETLEWLDTEVIVIKSTVEVGTTERLSKQYNRKIVFSPEYVGESTYWTPFNFHTDMKETPFYTFGGDKEECSKVIDLFLPVVGPCKQYNITNSTAAEMAKYMENAFYATKVAFCNELYDICEAVDVDWNEVRELWLSDPRLHRMHTAVFKDNRGFGGKCLPKDIRALVSIAEKNKCNSLLLRGVLSSNDIIRNKK